MDERVTHDGANGSCRALAAARVEPRAGAPRAEAHGDGLAALSAAAGVVRGEEGVGVDCNMGRVSYPLRWVGHERGEEGVHLLHSMKGVRKTSLSGMAAYCRRNGQRRPGKDLWETYENEDEEGDDAGAGNRGLESGDCSQIIEWVPTRSACLEAVRLLANI